MATGDTTEIFLEALDAILNDQREIFYRKITQLTEMLDQGYPIPSPTMSDLYDYIVD